MTAQRSCGDSPPPESWNIGLAHDGEAVRAHRSQALGVAAQVRGGGLHCGVDQMVREVGDKPMHEEESVRRALIMLAASPPTALPSSFICPPAPTDDRTRRCH